VTSTQIPGFALAEGIGTLSWFRETTATMSRFPFSSERGGFAYRAPAFLVLPHATFDAFLSPIKRGWNVRIRLEAVVPDGATPFAPLAVDAPFWQGASALSAHLGGPTLPLPDGPAGTLDSGRPYVGSGETSWTHAGIQTNVRTNRLEHVVVFDILGPDPKNRPPKPTKSARKVAAR
jgi:hypothetical protein